MLRPTPCTFTCAFVALLALAPRSPAQQRDTTPRIDTVSTRDTVPRTLAPVVTVARERGRSPLAVPFAVTTMQPDSMRPGQMHTQLDETLLLVPGVVVQNRDNPSQDPRVSIRGFGARSAFGVRGVRILRDGMPLTMPDGQTAVDYLDLESVGRIEVFRGSASALYGNASGGVVDLHTEAPPDDPFALQLRGWAGDYEQQRWTAAFGGTDGSIGYVGDINYTDRLGYRDYSRQIATSGYGKMAWTAGGTDYAVQVLGYNMPLGTNPGALTRAQADSAPWMADPFSVLKRARKSVSQGQVGLSGRHQLGDGQLTANVWGGTRDLSNPLTFAIVDVYWHSYGGGVRLDRRARFFGLTHDLTGGIDLARESDHRRNFANCNGAATSPNCPTAGVERGATSLDENETVSNVGPYVRDQIQLGARSLLSLGVRADVVRFEVDDNLITPAMPDASGARTLDAVSPMAGFVFRLTPLHSLYANVSSAFETPTTTELGNKPDGSAGLNPDLRPQYSTTYEVGAKGIAMGRMEYDLGVFDTEVRDELVPFEVPDGSGRTFYRNAGRTRRLGLEIGAHALLGSVELAGSYTVSHYRFRRFVVDSASYAGNAIPGVPATQLQLAATWRRAGWYATLEGIAASHVYADDANTAAARGYSIVNLRFGATSLFGNPWIAPMFGVDNLFDAKYIGSVNVNASNGKYYEPSPARTIYAGLTVAVGR